MVLKPEQPMWGFGNVWGHFCVTLSRGDLAFGRSYDTPLLQRRAHHEGGSCSEGPWHPRLVRDLSMAGPSPDPAEVQRSSVKCSPEIICSYTQKRMAMRWQWSPVGGPVCVVRKGTEISMGSRVTCLVPCPSPGSRCCSLEGHLPW